MKSDSSSIRVLYVINGLGTGGAERSLAELLEPLSERGIEVIVAVLYRRAEGVETEVARHHDVRFVGSGPLRSIRGIRTLIDSLGPHVIHTTIFESDVVGRLASIGSGIPIVTSLVNTNYNMAGASNPDVSRLKLNLVRVIDGFTARHINDGFHALTVSTKLAATQALRLPPDSIEVIPRGRSAARLGEPTVQRRAATRAKLRIYPEDAVLLSVGRREYQKGQIHAIEALRLLRGEAREFRLIIAGRSGGASEHLASAVRRMNLTDRVRFLGHRDDIGDLMVGSDVLVFPSLYEGFGGTQVEAMALGLPIVTSDLPVTREVCADAALFAQPGSPEDLASAIKRVMEDANLRSRLISTGHSRFEAHFSIDAVADSMAAFYRAQLAE